MKAPRRLLGPGVKRALRLSARRHRRSPADWFFVRGLDDELVVRRDAWGIPHLGASSRHDLLFGQGFVHAQDRLWQLELNRRAAAGRLAEILGPQALETDRLTRTLGFGRLARPTWDLLPQTARADLEAYAAGVNAYLALKLPRPLEFTLLRFEPARWEPGDSVAIARMLSWSLSSGWAGELTRARLIDHLGPDLAAAILPHYPDDHPLTLATGIEFNCLEPDGMLRAAEGPFLSRGPEGSGRGSNAWALAGSRTTTGRPLLCNDMHLPVTTPALWYHVHLRQEPQPEAGALHVSGVSQPGLPYVLVGHNARIAWGATLSFVDVEDLYVERLDAEGAHYAYEDGWRPLAVSEERIAVRGESDHVERVLATHHGPLISGVVPANGQALSLRSQALLPDAGFDGFALLNEAAGWNDFVGAVAQIASPSLNLVYADVDGNIGYYVTGRAPIRARGRGETPSPGWRAEHEWVGEVPFEEMPHALNPADGVVISANNQITGDDYPYFLGSCWRAGFRAARLHQLIADRDQISPADCQAFQMDVLSLPGQAIVAALGDLEPAGEAAVLGLSLLRSWDRQLDPESVGGLVYQVFLHELTAAVLSPRLDEELRALLLGAGPHPFLYPVSEFHAQWPATLLRLLESDGPWLPAAGRPALFARCLSQAVGWLRERLGPDPAGWQWGRVHQIRFPHVLGAVPILDEAFSQGPYPIGGDSETVAQTALMPAAEFDRTTVAPSFRQVIDLGDLDASVAMYPPGQSGLLGDPHYGDLIAPWLAGDFYPILWSDEQVARFAGRVQRLLPHPPV